MSKRVLIFRQGSLGDTVVALPCFYLIKKAFPDAERKMLTNLPINQKACASEMVLAGTDLVEGYLTYPPDVSLMKKFFIFRRLLKEWTPDVFIYLIESPSYIHAWRDFLFLKLCGIRKIIGLSLWKDLKNPVFLNEKKQYQYEGERLLDRLAMLGKIDIADACNRDMQLTQEEQASVEPYVASWMREKPFFVCSVGTKVLVKDWGQENWLRLMEKMHEAFPDWGMVFIGVMSESDRSCEALAKWQGPAINLCGKLSVRQSAVLLQKAALFIGHDSGPMHLAAAQNVPCVALFGLHNKPGVWFAYGENHEIIYAGQKGVLSIKVEDVMSAINRALAKKRK